MQDNPKSDLLYHIAETCEWEKSKGGIYVPSGYQSEGFIHLSLGNQLQNTYKRYYLGKSGLLLLTVCISDANKAHLKFEDFTGRGEFFPHFYMPLQKSDIVSVSEISEKSVKALDFLNRVMAT